MAPKKTATKAAAKPVKRLTTKGKPTADEQAKQVRRKNQANMVTQVKNAHDKLLKVQKGEIAVSDKEQEDLQVKAGFYANHPGPLRPGEVRHAGELHERQDVQLVAAAREKHSQRLLDHGRLDRRLGVQVRDCQGGGIA